MAEVTREVIDLVKRAKEVISVEEQWTRFAMARDKDGHSLRNIAEPWDEKAVCWCSVGALAKAAGDWDKYRTAWCHIQTTDTAVHNHFVTFNDQHTHAEVMEHWDNIIRDLEAKLEEQEMGTTPDG